MTLQMSFQPFNPVPGQFVDIEFHPHKEVWSEQGPTLAEAGPRTEKVLLLLQQLCG